MVRDDAVASVVRALRRVNFQGSIFGQSIAIRLGISESDVDALELLLDTGAATAGRLSELLGMTTGAVTRVVDRLEQAGYVRRIPDPADRRRVIVEVVPERAATLESLLASLETAAEREADRYTPDQLAAIGDFLGRMADHTGQEAARLRTAADVEAVTGPVGTAEHSAPRGGLATATLTFRSGTQELRLRPLRHETDLYRARFEGATPQVRLRDGRVIVHYKGLGFDWRKRVATMALSTALPWRLEILGGIQRLEADLREIDVSALELSGGGDRIQIELGRPAGAVPVRLIGGARTIRLERPAGVPVRFHLKGGAQRVEIDGRAQGPLAGDVVLETRDPDGPGHYAVDVHGGAKTIEVLARAE